MPVVIPTGFAQIVCTMVHSYTLQPAVNVFGFELPTTGLADVADELATAWETSIMANISDQYTFTDLKIRNADGTMAEVTRNTAGSDTGAGLPPQVSFLAKKVTGSPGRHNRGRVYIPGVNEPMVDANGTLDTGIYDNLQAGLLNWQGGISSTGGAHVLLHNDPAFGPAYVMSLQLEHVVATQRRRLKR